jgi:Asp-tRNA(Asn)/Glu-tRNA(Gln) amidotransferase A subunit family amidase
VALDNVLRTTGQPLNPLPGLFISLKDGFHVQGLDGFCGYVSWIGDTKTMDDEGTLVQKPRQAGAVIFVKINGRFPRSSVKQQASLLV